jgi:hypothetical protein
MAFIKIEIKYLKEITIERYKFLRQKDKLLILKPSLANNDTLEIEETFDIIED